MAIKPEMIGIVVRRHGRGPALFSHARHAFWGQRYAIVDDPHGNHVSIFAELK